MSYFDTKLGRVMISIVWGLGLSALFRKACTGRNCIVLKGPNPNEVEKQEYPLGFRTKIHLKK